MNTNHIALNLATKGLLNISNITKGIITFIGVVRIGVSGGSGAQVGKPIVSIPYGKNDKNEPIFKTIENVKNLEELKEIEDIDDIDSIIVEIDWEKAKKINKNITADIIKKHIEIEILKNNKKGGSINIDVV